MINYHVQSKDIALAKDALMSDDLYELQIP